VAVRSIGCVQSTRPAPPARLQRVSPTPPSDVAVTTPRAAATRASMRHVLRRFAACAARSSECTLTLLSHTTLTQPSYNPPYDKRIGRE
jgi:hypothetical protein